MHRVAVFVDAGYLFAQGSTALTGSKKKREDLLLNAPAVIQELKKAALASAADCSLLRIYWYDGASGAMRLTGEQALLANLDDVKVRLGFLNSAGQQKGVDSLIVTDLIELARQKAIFDAVLLSGDEDVRVGVQIAQNYGVRIHLIGIEPARGSQSPQLIQEADTTQEWSKEIVARFLSTRPIIARPRIVSPTLPARSGSTASTTETVDEAIVLSGVAQTYVTALQSTEIEAITAYWKAGRGLPTDFDRRLLPQGRDAIGADLDVGQKKHLRAEVQKLIRERLAGK